jgi:redox-sensitive bicupin YhaK (pirin superfamily)
MSETVLSVEALGFPWPAFDPFLFCVHHLDRYPAGNDAMGPAASSLAGRNLGSDFSRKDGWSMYHGTAVPGFPPHPHRGFETVTVMRQGFIDHSDSLGALARFGNGDVQWLTAGKGIVHAEMFPLLEGERPNPAELFQIWLNLPAKSKMAAPHFAMFWRDAIPRVTLRDSAGRATEVVLVAGRLGNAVPPSPPPDSWASDPASDLAIWTIEMDANAQWTLPPAHAGTNRTLYVYAGSGVSIDGREVPSPRLVRLAPERAASIRNGTAASSLLLLQGRPIGEPVVQYGPFVMNTEDEIRQTIRDYQRTQFGGWPFASDAPVHPRDQPRFARHADGREEYPR